MGGAGSRLPVAACLPWESRGSRAGALTRGTGSPRTAPAQVLVSNPVSVGERFVVVCTEADVRGLRYILVYGVGSF